MPKRLLRGVIDFGDGRITDENLGNNYQCLSRANFDWHNPDELKIYTFVKEYVQRNHEAPSSAVIKDFFERLNELTVTEKLDDIKAVEAHTRTHYRTILDNLLEDQNQNKFRKLLQDVEEIVTKGRVVGLGKDKTTIKGVKDGQQYFNQHIYEILPPETNARTEGEVLTDSDESWEAYQNAKINKDKVYGKFVGLDVVDVACHGVKPGELWIHAAAPGELKTTFSLNWAYNLVTRYRANVLYVSLEMKYDHLRRLVSVLHTANGKFAKEGLKPLDYRKVRDGELSSEDELFYQRALKDFKTNPEYCRLKVWAPDREVTIQDIRVYAEQMHRSMEVGLIVIDHGGLVQASKAHRDYTIELNSIIRESKKLALHFNGGEGIPVNMLFQINRQGKDSVDKQIGTEDEGRYRMSHLAYANEAEKSADYITTTYLNNTLRKQSTTIIGNLKNRDNDPFDLAKVRIDFACRRMRNWDIADQSDIGHSEISQEDLELT